MCCERDMGKACMLPWQVSNTSKHAADHRWHAPKAATTGFGFCHHVFRPLLDCAYTPHCLRFTCGVSRIAHVRNVEILSRCRTCSVEFHLKSKRWYANVCPLHDTRLPKKALYAQVQGRGVAGWPRKRCFLTPRVSTQTSPPWYSKYICLEGKDCHCTHLAYAGKSFNYYYYHNNTAVNAPVMNGAGHAGIQGPDQVLLG